MDSLEADTTAAGSRRFLALTALIIAAAAFVVVSAQSCGGNEYASMLSEQRVLSQRMANYASQALYEQDRSAFAKLKDSYVLFERNFQLLRDGNPETGMAPAPAEVLEELANAEKNWKQYSQNFSVVMAHEPTVTDMRTAVQKINEHSAELLALSDEIATRMANGGASPAQVYIASRQLMLSQRIVTNLNRVLESGENSVIAADRFGRDASLFGRVVDGLLEGNSGMGIARVQDPATRSSLLRVKDLFSDIGAEVSAILDRTPEMFRASEAVSQASKHSDELLQSITDFEKAYASYVGNRTFNFSAGSLFFVGLMIVVLIVIALPGGPGGRTLGIARQAPAQTRL